MTNMDELIERCSEVLSKWHDRLATPETVRDFAKVFDLELNWSLKLIEDGEPKKPVVKPEQSEFIFELSEDDQWAIKSWRENNGL